MMFAVRRLPLPLCRWLGGLLLVTHAVAASAAAGEPVKTEHVTAELVANAAAVVPGKTVQIGLRLQHIAHWHTYWRNPGDSGLPTTLTWTVPAGAEVGAIDWPAPKRLPIGPLVNYGYEGDLLLPVRFTAPANARPGSTLELKADASWLVCRDICIPENATLQLSLPVAAPGATPERTASSTLFERTSTRQAVALQGWSASVQLSSTEMLLRLDRDAGTPAAPAPVPTVHVFPYTEQLIEPARHELYLTPSGYAVRFGLAANASIPATFEAIAVVQSADGAPTPAGWNGGRPNAQFSAPIKPVSSLALPDGSVRMEPDHLSTVADARRASARATQQSRGGSTPLGLFAALLLALAGGMVLNLMPCVFPVLSIKLLSLAQHGTEKGELRAHAASYSAGVILSFIALAVVLIGLQAAGSAVGWGFQLQEPGVVFVLALLFFAIGLNLMGAFEFGNLLPQGLASWRARQPAADAFGAGVLAVVAASPCTAPFMGAALGFALTQTPSVALGIFATLGIGMALPYAALVMLPGWRARLPHPGVWMLRLKQLLAFPMFATVVWLVWVLGLQSGIDGAARALLALVGLGFVFWLAGAMQSESARRTASGLAVVALAALLIWSWPATLPSVQAADVAIKTTPSSSVEVARWQTYSDAGLQQQLADGRPVFVDFTAAWCVSCQINKRLVLTTQSAQLAFAQAEVALMRADWTRGDAEITAALARLGRNGVPVYALHRPGKEPLLLPEILTLGLLRDALSTLKPQ